MEGKRAFVAAAMLSALVAGCDKTQYKEIKPSSVSQSYVGNAAFPRAADMRENYLVLRDANGSEVRLRGPEEAIRTHTDNGHLFTFSYPVNQGSEPIGMNDVKISPRDFYRGILTNVSGSVHTDVAGRELYGEVILDLVDINGTSIRARYTPDAKTTREYVNYLGHNLNRIVTVGIGPGRLGSLTFDNTITKPAEKK